ncbi:unknown protein [Desulfotalea psychrophila LSv54]|uniref:Uncharacterized protein n=1 Tax=Desulfotalea psychrophila (strain LSv54 / DSM 12343) TaxID=177439 RepID=Q6ALE8_DESPS|nr:unknown protein [Desulfotalea psychrophila LSv54]
MMFSYNIDYWKSYGRQQQKDQGFEQERCLFERLFANMEWSREKLISFSHDLCNKALDAVKSARDIERTGESTRCSWPRAKCFSALANTIYGSSGGNVT